MKKKARWILLNIEELISGIALTGMLCFTVFNVTMRYVFNRPKGWATELSIICLVWATFTGAAGCFKRNQHYGMDFLVTRLPRKAQFRLRQALMFVSAVLLTFLAVMAIGFTITSTKATSYFMIPYRYINSAAAIGFTSMAIYAFHFSIMSIRDPEGFWQYYEISYDDVEMEMNLEGDLT